MTEQLSIIFKPTTRCNLRCRYCYAARERNEFDGTMSIDEAKRSFDWIKVYCEKLHVKNVTVIWHGGEPLLMGIQFINDCVEYYTKILNELSITVRNQIQTNLTLATDDYIPLLKKHFESRIGFSLDYQSHYRLFPNGKDATDAIIERAMTLKNAGLKIAAISMMTADNLGKMNELYNWFKALGIPFRLNRIFPTSSEETNGMAKSVTAEQYANGICELFDIWLNDPHPASIETVQGAVLAYIRNISKLCSLDGKCADSFLCIASNGTLLPCGRFDSDSYSIGNIYTDTIEQVLDKKKSIAHLQGNHSKIAECITCKWKSLCVAGCPHSKLFGWFEDECITNKIIWNHLEERLTPFGLTKGILSDLSKEEAYGLLSQLPGDEDGVIPSAGNPTLFR
jgi:uncharacterized protein